MYCYDIYIYIMIACIQCHDDIYIMTHTKELPNFIYLMSCTMCYLQYVGDTSQEINKVFN